ncbi:oxidative stress defense protein [Parashewanella spongiae]|nr:oxidative stress defense protein [Parashewanella spongiae]MCL1078513.1 oxidative stress defense protein [Parashewanella spongiae]
MTNKTMIVLSAFITLIATSNVSSHALEYPHIETVGTSSIEVKPDMAEISVSVNMTGQTAKQAKADSDKAVSTLIKKLMQANIAEDDIDSANLQLHPQYRYQPEKEPILMGYQASRNVTIKVRNLTELNIIIDKTVSSGVNQVNHISFKSSRQEQFVEQARQAAITNAKNKAQSLAKGFGQQIDRVWEVKYFNSSAPRPLLRKAAFMGNISEADKSYQNTKITIQDRVEVVFTLK